MDPFVDEENVDLLEAEDKPRVRPFSVGTSQGRRTSSLGFTAPLSWRWFVSVVGTEYCHTYFWIAKDLAWMQGLRESSLFFGLLALGWSLVILYHALRTVNWHEIWNFVALFLWLFANFVWMRGEAHDYEYPDEMPIANESSNLSALILMIAFVWLLVYYGVFLPFNIIHSSKASLLEYDDGQLRPRCSAFRNFRQYENIHMLFWISKDLAWNRLNLPLWLLCLFPTIYISADLFLIAVTSNSTEYTLDVTHFGVTLIWVTANSVWAFGDFFIEQYDEPLGIWDSSEETLMTARWYAAWILAFDIAIVVCTYGVWLTLTLTGRLTATEGDTITHKHSLTGLNLFGGNGVLSYEEQVNNNNNGGHLSNGSGSLHGNGGGNSTGAGLGGFLGLYGNGRWSKTGKHQQVVQRSSSTNGGIGSNASVFAPAGAIPVGLLSTGTGTGTGMVGAMSGGRQPSISPSVSATSVGLPLHLVGASEADK